MHIFITNDDGYLDPGMKFLTEDASEGTDFYATDHRTASVSPMQIDLTRHRGILPLQNRLDAL